MPKIDKRVDAYIEKSQDFAKPILLHIRALVHEACPQLTETIKWSFPHFDYKGMMFSMASFKQHCSVGFWKASLMKDDAKLFSLGELHDKEAEFPQIAVQKVRHDKSRSKARG